jgi:excisionase family DNA binding protein
MPGVKGYSLTEVANQVGVVKATIVRWIETRKVKIPKRKNVRGHYVFTEADLKKLIEYKNRVR